MQAATSVEPKQTGTLGLFVVRETRKGNEKAQV